MEDASAADFVVSCPSGWPNNDDSAVQADTKIVCNVEQRCDSVVSAEEGWAGDETDAQFIYEDEEQCDIISIAETHLRRKKSRPKYLQVKTRLVNRQVSYKQMLEDYLTKEEMRFFQKRYDSWVWPNGTTLRWTCLNGDLDQEISVAGALNDSQAWTHGANLALHHLPPARSVNQKTPRVEIRIELHNASNSHSSVGNHGASIPRQDPTMWLAEDAEPNTIIHEFGHAIGLGHEHQRWISDIEFDVDCAREQAAKIDAAAGIREHQPESDPEQQIISKDKYTIIDPFEYDPHSIMHYDLRKYDDSAFKSSRPEQCTTPYMRCKDRKLVAYLYPLPAGGTIRPKHMRKPGTKLPRHHLQAIMLPHVWSTVCRAMLGINALRWSAEGASSDLRAQVVARNQRCFHVDTTGNNSQATLSYLAIDPSVAHVQMSSRKSYVSQLSYKSIDPEADHFWEHHRLRLFTSSKAKVITWINELYIPASKTSFEVSVHSTMNLSWEMKRLGMHIRTTAGVTASTNWAVINPDAINIDGGNVDWHTSDGAREGKVRWKTDFFPWLDHKQPHVMVGVNGLKYHRCEHHGENDEARFEIAVTCVDYDGFDWKLVTCHDKCFSELSFSWIVVPHPVMSFGLPKSDKKPKHLPAPWSRDKKHNQPPAAEDVYEEVGALFNDTEAKTAKDACTNSKWVKLTQRWKIKADMSKALA